MSVCLVTATIFCPPVLYIPPDWFVVIIFSTSTSVHVQVFTVNKSVHMQVFTVTSTLFTHKCA